MNAEEIKKKLSDLPIFILDDDIKIYQMYMSSLASDAKVLDLGTGWGKSVLAMALSNLQTNITTIDTGEYQIANNWADNQQDYQVKINQQFAKYGVSNIHFTLADVLTYPIEKESFDLIHMDMVVTIEAKILERFLPALKKGGIFLIRNYQRFKDKVEKICQGYQYVTYQGLIQVIKKV